MVFGIGKFRGEKSVVENTKDKTIAALSGIALSLLTTFGTMTAADAAPPKEWEQIMPKKDEIEKFKLEKDIPSLEKAIQILSSLKTFAEMDLQYSFARRINLKTSYKNILDRIKDLRRSPVTLEMSLEIDSIKKRIESQLRDSEFSESEIVKKIEKINEQLNAAIEALESVQERKLNK